MLKKGFLQTYLKSPEIKALGIVFDADIKPAGRYSQVCSLCKEFFQFPKTLPVDGVIVENEQTRLGIWIMPGNSSEGDLETFLKYLVPNTAESLWKHAIEAVGAAQQIGSSCKAVHIPKANLYTWLAWQDPPGQSPGRALTQRVLDPHSQSAMKFVNWFRQLYRL